MQTKNILILILLFVSTICNAQQYPEVALSTPNGSTVYARLHDAVEYAPYQIESINENIKSRYPEAEFLDNSTLLYNCHTYAWYLTEGGQTKCWMLDPSPYWNDGSYVETDASHAEKIFYYAGRLGDTHSAVVSKTHPGKYESKWGNYPLMRHSPGYGPEQYNMNYRRYYKKATSTILTWNDIYVSLTNTGSKVDFEIKFHSDANKTVSFDVNDYNTGRTDYKAEWLVNDDNWGWLASGPRNAWTYISKPLTSGRLYLAARQDDQYYLYKSSGFKGSYSFTKLTGSKWRFRMDSWPNNGNMFEFVIPIQLVIYQRNGAPLVYNIALYCSTWGTESSFTWQYLFPIGRSDTPPSYTRAVQNSIETSDITQLSDKVDVKVYNLSGKLVFSKKNVDRNFNINEMPLSNDIYIIEKFDGKKKYSEKVILRK